tara:strand:- start:1571 stop:2539 length:969 start_codon:yes stop_codon:yes gene_type:complete
MIITVKKKLTLIEACFGKVKVDSSSKNASVVCPVCSHQGKITNKRKLSIVIDTGVYHCWVCETKGRNIGSLGVRYSDQKAAANNLKSCYGSEDLSSQDTSNEIEKVFLPKDFSLLCENMHKITNKRYVNYLLRRGFTRAQIAEYRIGVSSEYGFKDRVIFPSFDKEQNLNYFIARSIDKNERRRYKNCSHPRKNLIFREFDLDFNSHLILTEGVFDLVNCPENSTCVLGSWLDERYLLFQEIVKNRTPVTICFDPDAQHKAIKVAKNLHEYCVDVKVSLHKGKDFGDMLPEEVHRCLSDAKPYDNVERVEYLISELRSGSIF